jgi:hypothetical protein
MPLPGQLTVADALVRAPAGTNKTNLTTDLNQLLTDLNTAVTNGGLSANVRDTVFYDLLLGFAQTVANELKS